MSKNLGLVAALVGICALSLFLLSCGSSSSRPSGVLYVLTQGSTGVGNNVSSFTLDFDNGGLSLVNSDASTCPTVASQDNPEPCGLPLDILLDPTGAVAFVLNQGSPCIPNPPTCVPAGAIPPTIYSYGVNSDGSIGAPSMPAAATLSVGDTAIAMARDPGGNFLFVITESPQLLVFSTTPGSKTLTPVETIPLTKSPSALSVVNFTPTNGTAQEYLYVTNNHDDCTGVCVPPHNDNTVSVYTVGSDGTLAEQPNSPYAIAAINPISVIAVNTNPAGTNSGGLFVYVGSQDSSGGHLYPFEVCTVINAVCSSQDVTNALMVPLATCSQISCDIPPSSAGQSPIEMVVDPTNAFLYVLSEGSNQVFGFKINAGAGTLTSLNPASQPTGSQPVALALHPTVNNTGQFLYTSNSNSSNITGFTLSTTSGAMSDPITVVAPAAPSGMTVR